MDYVVKVFGSKRRYDPKVENPSLGQLGQFTVQARHLDKARAAAYELAEKRGYEAMSCNASNKSTLVLSVHVDTDPDPASRKRSAGEIALAELVQKRAAAKAAAPQMGRR